ncbi:hypothetical protein [Gymnodinialimonas sp.]
MALLLFIMNTAMESANKPGSKLFLPTNLANIKGDNSQGKLLPLEEDTITVGPITGSTGGTITQAFSSNWLLLYKPPNPNHEIAIPDPSTPYPVLTLGNIPGEKVRINGLSNVYVRSVTQTGQTADSATFKIALDFGFWNSTNGGTGIPSLSVVAPYSMAQKLCLAPAGQSTCSGTASVDINGDGTVDLDISNAQIVTDATVSVSKVNGKRMLSVRLSDLTISGAKENTSPVLDIKDLTIGGKVSKWLKGAWKDLATSALTSPDASRAIFDNIQAQLNSANNINAVSHLITQQLQVVMDDLLGKVDGTLPPTINEGGQTQVDLYLFDRVFYAMNTPTSSWFLPRTLCSMSNPKIDPYTADQISLGDLTVEGITFSKAQLTNVKVEGLSNLVAPAKTTVFAPGSISVDANLAALQPPPKLDCCTIPATTQVTAKFSANGGGVQLDADLTVKITAATLKVTADAEGNTTEELDVKVVAMSVVLADLSDMTIVAKMQTNGFFLELINKILNGDDVKSEILKQINAELTHVLPQISQAATNLGRSIIKNNVS